MTVVKPYRDNYKKQKKFYCPICDTSFTGKSELYTHFGNRKHHLNRVSEKYSYLTKRQVNLLRDTLTSMFWRTLNTLERNHAYDDFRLIDLLKFEIRWRKRVVRNRERRERR